MHISKSGSIGVAMAATLMLLIPVGSVGAQAGSLNCEPVTVATPSEIPNTPLRAGESIALGGSLVAPGGETRLSFSSEGELTLHYQDEMLWTSGTADTVQAVVENKSLAEKRVSVNMQADGNLAIVSAPGTGADTVYWHSDTSGNPKAELRVYVNGRAAVVAADGTELWSTGPGVTPPPPTPPRPVSAVISFDPPGFVPGQTYHSLSGTHSLTFHESGNLALYRGDTNLWNSGTDNGDVLAVSDGNLVMRSGGSLAVVWETGTSSDEGTTVQLRLRDDGFLDLVEIDADGNEELLWQVGEAAPTPDPTIYYRSVSELRLGDEVGSPDGCHVLVLQSDGNLVLYQLDNDGEPKSAVWESETSFQRGSDLLARAESAVMQKDGNFVLYQVLPGSGTERFALWHSDTAGNDGAKLRLHDDGRLVIVSADGDELWSIGGSAPGYDVTYADIDDDMMG